MRILIDLQACQSGSCFGGIGRYSMSLAKAMLQLNSKHEISLLLNSRLPNENFIRAEFANLMPQQNILTFSVPAYIAAENDLPAQTRFAELIRELRIAEINPDVLHVASLFEGAGEDVVTSVGLLFPAERTAVTLYDLIPYLEQDLYLTNQMLKDHYMSKFEGLKRAGMIVSISAFSRAEALQHTSIPANLITNISSAVDHQFSQKEIDEESRIALLQKLGIQKSFLMFTGSFDGRKNHDRLVKGFAKIPVVFRQQYQLVIVGKGEDRQVSRLQSVGQSQGLKAQDIVFVGQISDEELVGLYNLCSLFVFPSLREGFGLPVLEAMSCGVPTIGSNRTSIPEVIDRLDALFDPEDVEDIAAKMTSVLKDAVFRAELTRHGLERAKQFSWQLSAKRALAFFERRMGVAQTSTKAIVQSDVDAPGFARNANVYNRFLARLEKRGVVSLDTDFIDSAARVIATNELLTQFDGKNQPCNMRIGWVTSWDSESEASASARRLIETLRVHSAVFAPHAKAIRSVEEFAVMRCWKSGKGQDISDLQKALSNELLDVVVVHYGREMFEISSLVEIVTHQKELKRHVFVIMHSTADLPQQIAQATKLEIKGAFKICDGIFVSNNEYIKLLEAMNVKRNVYFLPDASKQHQGNIEPLKHQVNLTADYFLRKMAFLIAVRSEIP